MIAHNDPSPARDRVLRLYERKHAPINIQLSLPSLDGIKRAVEMGVGVAVLPRRCALTEIERGDLVAVKVPELSARRVVRFVFRRAGDLSHAAAAFLQMVRAGRGGRLGPVQVRQPRGHLLDFFEPVQQQPGRVPRSFGKRVACRGGRVTGTSTPAADTRMVDKSSANTVPGLPSASSISRLPSSGVTETHGMPSATELPKKISEKDTPTTARIPRRRIACGACSRDEPQPKFASTNISVALR